MPCADFITTSDGRGSDARSEPRPLGSGCRQLNRLFPDEPLGALPRPAFTGVVAFGVRAAEARAVVWKPCNCSANPVGSAAPVEACVVEEAEGEDAEEEEVAAASIARMVTRWEMQMGSQRPDSSIQTDRDAGAVTGF